MGSLELFDESHMPVPAMSQIVVSGAGFPRARPRMRLALVVRCYRCCAHVCGHSGSAGPRPAVQ